MKHFIKKLMNLVVISTSWCSESRSQTHGGGLLLLQVKVLDINLLLGRSSTPLGWKVFMHTSSGWHPAICLWMRANNQVVEHN
jgi:hypothetical protein